jgi:hypothetical protein
MLWSPLLARLVMLVKQAWPWRTVAMRCDCGAVMSWASNPASACADSSRRS